MPSPSIDECVAHAEECERQAAMALSDIVRKHFLTSAASWRRQAAVPALATAIIEAAGKPYQRLAGRAAEPTARR